MNLKHCLLIAGLTGLPAAAFADAPQNYFGISVDGVDLELANGTERHMNGFNLRYGLWFPFDLLAVEFRIGQSSESTNNVFGDPEVQYFLGLGKVNLPFEKVNLYMLGGVSRANYDFAGVETDEDDIVGGFGIELLASETTGFTIEYLRYGIDDDAIEGAVISLGFNHRFELPGFR